MPGCLHPYTVLRLVNRKSAGIFNRILESWNRSKSGKNFAEILWAKNMRIGVNYVRIKHIPAVGDGNASLTQTLLQDAAGPPSRPPGGAERPELLAAGIARAHRRREAASAAAGVHGNAGDVTMDCFAGLAMTAKPSGRPMLMAEFPGFPNTGPSQALAAIVPVTASGANFAAYGQSCRSKWLNRGMRLEEQRTPA